jgi:type VI secretion system FHA domain protein
VSAAAHVRTTAPAKRAAEKPVRPPPPSTKSAVPAAPANSVPSTALDAFFRGAGLPAQKLDEKQTEQTLLRLGQLMREIIVGVGENLHVRTEQKNALRVPTTTIQPQNNNPLKFSASVEEAMHNLLFRQSAEYLGAVESAREVFVDIKQHQHSLFAALRTAISDYIGRLDPDELESKFTSGKRGGLMNAANKLKYWDLYKDLYQVVSQHQPGQFPQQFLEEMARAYEHESVRAGVSPTSRKPQAKAS